MRPVLIQSELAVTDALHSRLVQHLRYSLNRQILVDHKLACLSS